MDSSEAWWNEVEAVEADRVYAQLKQEHEALVGQLASKLQEMRDAAVHAEAAREVCRRCKGPARTGVVSRAGTSPSSDVHGVTEKHLVVQGDSDEEDSLTSSSDRPPSPPFPPQPPSWDGKDWELQVSHGNRVSWRWRRASDAPARSPEEAATDAQLLTEEWKQYEREQRRFELAQRKWQRWLKRLPEGEGSSDAHNSSKRMKQLTMTQCQQVTCCAIALSRHDACLASVSWPRCQGHSYAPSVPVTPF